MNIQYVLELLGTGFFAISGALAIQNKEHDWFGIGFTGFVTAIGGGTLRDILLGSYPLVWIADINFLYAILGGLLAVVLFAAVRIFFVFYNYLFTGSKFRQKLLRVFYFLQFV